MVTRVWVNIQYKLKNFYINLISPFHIYIVISILIIKNMRAQCTIFVLSLLIFSSYCGIYDKYYAEAYSIAAAMTVDQKIGQTVQLEFFAITGKNGTDPALATKYHLGSLLVGGDGVPDANGNLVQIPDMNEPKTIAIYQNGTMQKWQKLSQKFNNLSTLITTNQGKTYDIRLLLGTDAVHNNQHVIGTILFPHNIGLSCSHNPTNFYNMGKWTAINVKKSGFNYAFAPTVAVSHNPQWGRFYQTIGQQQEWIYKYGKSYTEGLQGRPDALTGILGSVKHFMGDGATMYGADQGNAHVGSYKSFIQHNIQGYAGSIASEIGSVMCSYSAINWLPLAISPLIDGILRRKYKFDGFVISDYDEIKRLRDQQQPTNLNTFNDYNGSTCLALNAGIDMVMIPGRKGLDNYIESVKIGLKNNTITMDRLNDAVAKIISVKLALGVAKLKPKANIRQPQIRVKTLKQLQQMASATTEYEDSLQAVHESLVLLKNTNVLPIKPSTLQYVVLVGEKIININNLAKNQLFLNYDNIGMQSGGWSVRWQGFQGNSQWKGQAKTMSNASSILDALEGLKQKFQIVRPNYTTFTQQIRIDIQRNEYLNKLKTLRKKMNAKNTLILAVVGESPYAEFSGDVGIPYCQNATILSGDGCLYLNGDNPYMPQKQKASLDLEFNKFQEDVITHIREQDKNIPLVTVMLAGRPMFIDKILNDSNAVLHAFLPGTSGGQGIVDALTGAYVLRPNGQTDLRNTLSFDWPKTTAELARFPVYGADGKVPTYNQILFKVGHGLSTSTA